MVCQVWHKIGLAGADVEVVVWLGAHWRAAEGQPFEESIVSKRSMLYSLNRYLGII